MTLDHPVRRLLARICSAGTMARVVDPVLADMRFESERPAWLGYLALARGLALHSVVSLPDRTRRVWTDDDSAVPKTLVACVAIAGLLAASMIVPFLTAAGPGRVGTMHAVALLTPQALILALPASLLFAIPVALGRVADRRRLILRGVGISLLCVIPTLMLIVVMPDTNQAFRVAMSGQADIARGPTEVGFRELREQIDTLNLTPGGRRVARSLEYAYQVRLALGVIALPLGLLGLALPARATRWRRPWVIGAASSFLYLNVTFALANASEFAIRRWSLPPTVLAWTPCVVIAAAALAAHRWSARRRVEAAS